MDTIVAGQFWMKGGSKNVALSNHDRMVIDGRDHLNDSPDFGNPGCPNENGPEGFVESSDLQAGLE